MGANSCKQLASGRFLQSHDTRFLTGVLQGEVRSTIMPGGCDSHDRMSATRWRSLADPLAYIGAIVRYADGATAHHAQLHDPRARACAETNPGAPAPDRTRVRSRRAGPDRRGPRAAPTGASSRAPCSARCRCATSSASSSTPGSYPMRWRSTKNRSTSTSRWHRRNEAVSSPTACDATGTAGRTPT